MYIIIIYSQMVNSVTYVVNYRSSVSFFSDKSYVLSFFGKLAFS